MSEYKHYDKIKDIIPNEIEALKNIKTIAPDDPPDIYLYMEETVRLNKFLSEKGICSRREADRLVDEGKVMVNGVCAVMGQKVSSADEIVVDGKKVSTKQVKPVLIAVNKPAGIVCTTARFEGEKNIVDMVKYPTRIYPIGRLDKESEGLILMTNLGDLANEISKARAHTLCM